MTGSQSADVEIRPYEAEDYEATVALWRAVSLATYTFLEPHTEAEDRAYFRDVIVPENEVVVATRDGVIVAFMARRGDLIDRLYVAVGLQRQGVGAALLEHARACSPEGLRLFTHQKNEGARKFYEAQGFLAARFGVSPPPESEPDVEYVWPRAPTAARRTGRPAPG